MSKILFMGPIKSRLWNKIQEGFLLAIVICPVPADFWNREVFNLPEKNRAELAQAIDPAKLDALRREKLAELLQDPKKVYIELPETKVARQISIDLSDSEALERARILTQWNRNELVLETLSDLSGCEETYLKGLAYRRLRKYSDAKSTLQKAVQTCEGDFKKKALFLNTRLAAMNPSERTLQVLNDFLRAYPHDTYTDDVLLWKAHALMEMGHEVAALQTLNRLLNHYPAGDRREQALFERALAYARVNQLGPALRVLDQIHSLQATYWRGRLRLFPDLNHLDLNPDLKVRAQGKKILRDLAQKVPFSYYGHWAMELSQTPSSFHPARLKLPKSKVLKADPAYQIMTCFKKNKRFEEAVWVVDRLTKSYRSEPEQMILAKQYLELQRPDKAHQIMRNLGLAFPQGDQFPWQLAFPKAYEKEFEQAAKRENMPVEWLMGLCREESQFDKDAISWAGAVGLCQLLPSTAKKSETELLDPLINIDTGAMHLKEIRANLKHPLLVIAAYNAGEKPVTRWVKNSPDMPMDIFVELIPYEQTRHYVKKVSSAWAAYAWLNGRLNQGLYLLVGSHSDLFD